MKSINLNIKSVDVKSETRKLRYEWTREMAHDIAITGSFDVEIFARTVMSEIKRTKIKNKINNIFSKHDS